MGYRQSGVTLHVTIEAETVKFDLWDVRRHEMFNSVRYPLDMDLDEDSMQHMYDLFQGYSVVCIIVNQLNYTLYKSDFRIALEHALEKQFGLKPFTTDRMNRCIDLAPIHPKAKVAYSECNKVLIEEDNIILEHLRPYLIDFSLEAMNAVLHYVGTTLPENAYDFRIKEVLRLLATYVDICNEDLLLVNNKLIKTDNTTVLALSMPLDRAIAYAHRGVFTLADKRRLEDGRS